jgi:hypothetical protein
MSANKNKICSAHQKVVHNFYTFWSPLVTKDKCSMDCTNCKNKYQNIYKAEEGEELATS